MKKIIIHIFLLLTICVGDVWGWDIHGRFYFNNTNNWSEVSLVYGNDNNSCAKTFFHIENTQLWCEYVDYDGYNDLYFIPADCSGWECNSQKPWDRIRDSYSSSNVHPGREDYKDGKKFYFTSSTHQENLPTYTAYFRTKLSEDGGSTYGDIVANGTQWKAKFDFTGTYMSNDYTSAQSTISNLQYNSWNDGTEKYGYEGIPVTGEVTFTLQSFNDPAYELHGWGVEGDDTPSNHIEDNSVTYNISSTTVYVAFLKRKQFAVNFAPQGDYSTGTVSAEKSSEAISSGAAHNYGSSITFTATPATGYKIEGWYSDADCTVSLENGTNTTYTIASLTAASDVYVKFAPKECTISLDYQSSSGGWASNGNISNAGSLRGVYNAAMTALTGTMPIARNGWAFMGFYTEPEGGGTQYYNADGSSAATWVIDTESPTTLYAYFKRAEITELVFAEAIVEAEATVRVTATIAPTPTPTTILCWRLLRLNGNELPDQPDFSSAGGAAAEFEAPAASGSYMVEATLHLSGTCGGGEVISTRTAVFQVAGDHQISVQYKCGEITIAGAEGLTGHPLNWTAVSAPEIFGYTFSRWEAGDGISLRHDAATNANEFKATYDGGVLTATYTQNQMIYFMDNLGWTDPEDEDAHIYVNFLNGGYWDSDQGSGNESLADDRRNKAMNRVPGTTNIFYYNYGATITIPTAYVSFTKQSLDNQHGFSSGNTSAPALVCYPTIPNPNNAQTEMPEFGFNAQTPLFVPASGYPGDLWNNSLAKYYNSGYWTKYTPGTGYYLRIYDPNNENTLIKRVAFTSADDLMPMTVTTNLETNRTYKFEVEREGPVYLSNGNNTMTYANRNGQGTAWELYHASSNYKKTGFTTTSDGDYVFHLTYANNGSGVWRPRIAADYPIADGDYRLLYKDDIHTGFKPSAIIAKENGGKDTISFFVRHDQNPVLRIQKSIVADDGTTTWSEYPTPGTPTNQITGSIASAIASTGVYNFYLEMDESGELSIRKAAPYTGDYYIRTDCANSKWDNYRSDPDHKMTYSEYSAANSNYTHYFCHWVDQNSEGRKNVKFCIANDYSPCISDTLTREEASGEWANITSFINASGDILRSANVRFMWNETDNSLRRAYIDGAQGNEDNSFLVLINSNNKVLNPTTGVAQAQTLFSDNENWIYEANIKAEPEALIRLKSTWGSGTVIEQYFKGSSSSNEYLFEGSGDDPYDVRLIYDFKTNRLLSAIIPSGTISSATAVHADVMFVREGQEDIEQLSFSGEGNLSDIETAYGVMRFNKWTLNNKSKDSHTALAAPLSIYERGLYFISFPFRVSLEEVFGIGQYGTHWIIQQYNGARRAAEGFWAESSGFWEYIWDRRGVYLEPNQGYLLSLDLDQLGESSPVWANNNEQVELFFPSSGTMPTISSADVVHTIPEHACTINRHESEGLPKTNDPRTSYDRTIFDSHWNVIGVPTYINTANVTFAQTSWTAEENCPSFLYTWNADDNSLTATDGDGYNYHAMHAYIVQYYGTIQWSARSGSPYSIVAKRTYDTKPRKVTIRLELQQEEKMIDRTYIKLIDDEEVSEDFRFGEDLCKEFGSKASIFSMIGEVAAAGNSLPMSETKREISIGLTDISAGQYTFSIPEGTEGIGVMLVDKETGVRTQLSAVDYSVYLESGDYLERFEIEVSGVNEVATGIEGTSDSSASGTERARKVMIDGALYIIREGKIYDSLGRMQ